MQKTDLKTVWQHCSRPERVVWAVAEHKGRRSICPLGWKMKTSFSPPMMAVSVAPSRFTHGLIVQSESFVLAWPGEDLAEATLFCGTHSGRDLDKFDAAGLTPLPGRAGPAPLIAECIANLECRLTGQMTSGDHSIFAGEILAAWLHPHPRRQLCSVDAATGYDCLLEKGGYRLGVVKAKD